MQRGVEGELGCLRLDSQDKDMSLYSIYMIHVNLNVVVVFFLCAVSGPQPGRARHDKNVRLNEGMTSFFCDPAGKTSSVGKSRWGVMEGLRAPSQEVKLLPSSHLCGTPEELVAAGVQRLCDLRCQVLS